MRVLACDGIHEDGLALFRAAGWDVDVSDPIKDPAELAARLGEVDALLVRSATPVTAEALAGATKLKVIGRAGAGVDTIDVDAATARGIAVMNAPDGNTLAAAEHALSLLFALARHVPRADAGMKAGEWPKAGLTGFELEGKKLGVVGLGRIGATVARKALGIGMDVAAFDPFLPAAAAGKGSVPLMTLDALLAWADVVTLHVPRTKETTNLLDAARLRAMKPGAFLVNAARGGLVDEAALLQALDDGHLGGAALDTFATEPLPKDSPLRGHPKLILTPHLGASTGEAQQAVSTILARQVHAAGDGDGFDRLLKLRVEGGGAVRGIEATLHRGPRVVRLDGVELDFDPLAHLLLMRNDDRPGVIGLVGSHLGAAGVNIVNFSLGATGDGGAIAAITVDRPVEPAQLASLRGIPGIRSMEQF